MRLIFMGTPDFAVPTLSALAEAGHEIGMVVTRPDQARDRGKKIKFPPVKEKALELGLEVEQPERVKANDEFIEKVRAYEPDAIIVVAYGRLLPTDILDIPKFGCINVHASLLPKYRGAAPIQRSILEGDEVTGVTIMYLDEEMDTGDMLAKTEVTIGDKNAAELSDALSEAGATLLVETLCALEDGTAVAEKQKEEDATYAAMIFKKDGEIDFSKSPKEILCMVKGLDPWPGAYTYLDGELFKIWDAEVLDKSTDKPNGMVLGTDADGILIAAAGGVLKAKLIQVPGKKKMLVKDYLKGHNIAENVILG